MKFVSNIDEKTNEINFGTLVFDSGKKIMLDAGEVEEMQAELREVKDLTHNKEFYVTGAFVKGVQLGSKKLLVVTQIEEDTFSGGETCNAFIYKEYGL